MKPNDVSTPISDEERQLWEMCDRKHFLGRLNEVQNCYFISELKKASPEESRKWKDKGKEIYHGILRDYETIDTRKLDERYSPDVINETHGLLLGLECVLGNYTEGALECYIKKFGEIHDKFNTPRYKMYRDLVGEKERKR
jgi:hypothetical protein